MILPRRFLAFVLLVCVLYSCAEEPAGPRRRVALDKEVFSSNVSRGQIYWGVGDTTAWEAWLGEADSVVRAGAQLNIYRDTTSFQVLYDSARDRYHSAFPLPHFDRHFDTLARRDNIIRMLDNRRVRASIRAADLLLGRDSVRLGLIRVEGPAFGFYPDTTYYPDYLLITTPGNDRFPIAMDQDNVGPVSRQTVFRVGRGYYGLTAVGENYDYLEIEPLADGRGFPLAAELDTYYKPVPVTTTSGKNKALKRERGKMLILYFWGLGPRRGKDVLLLNKVYRHLPAAERERLQLVLVNVNNSREAVRNFWAENDLDLTTYFANAKTCVRMNCHPALPYYVDVSDRGRVLSYYRPPESLIDRLTKANLPAAPATSR